MPTVVQFRRGTTAQNDAFTGAVGEISVDTQKDTIRVHDGSTAGGFELLQRNLTNQTIGGSIVPDTDSAYDLGSASNKWRSLYLSGNTIVLGSVVLKDNNGTLSIQDSSGVPLAGTFSTVTTSGNVTVGGNLVVNGTTTAINSTVLDVEDLNITVAKGAADSAAANGAGLTVDGAGAYIVYDHAAGTWDLNRPLNAGFNVLQYYNTTQIAEGDNLYYTTTRADSDFDVRLTTKSTDDLTEGSNLYYTTVRADSDFDVRLTTKSTDDVAEGNNLYYTTARADSDAKNAISGSTGITYSSATGTITTNDGQIVHDNLSGFVVNEHIDHSSVTLTAGAGLTGGGDITTSRTFNIGAGTGVTVNADNVAIGQDVGTTANVTFGSVSTSGDITIGGNLQVNGTTTSLNTTTLDVEDKNITIADGAADGAAADGAGITVDGALATILYTNATDTWDFNKPFGTGTNVIQNYTTTELTEGDNLYYTTARADSDFDARLAIKSTTNLTEGSNLYYTTERADSDAKAAITGGTGITYSLGTISTNDSQIIHDNLSGFVANEHIDHTTVSVTAGSGLTGGGTIAATRTINIGQGTGITVSADAISTNDGEIVHDNLSGFVSNEHIDHTSVTLTAGVGLNGGGDISSSREFNIDSAELYANFAHDDFHDYVADEHVAHSGVSITAGNGLTGGGTIAASRTLNIGQGTGITVGTDAISTNDGEIVHDNLSGFVANEHIDHTTVSVTAGAGLTGGGTIAASRTLNIGQGTGITVGADAISTNDAQIVHDNLSGFVSDEHVAHSGVTLTAGVGLNGGGTIAASRTFNIDSAELYANFAHDNFHDYVADEHIAHSGVTITAGNGLTGGGTIAASRTLNIGQGTGITVGADTISTNDAQIVHDNLSGFVADEHVAHSSVTMTAGNGLTGGGTIAASRTFNVGAGTGVTVSADAVSIGQDVATTADVTFASVETTGNIIVGGNLQVTGTTTTVNSQSLEVTDNMIYMNAGESDGSPTQSIDVGWAANVNDGGSYTHVGMFRDATDDRFKVYGAYTPEPDAALEINTGHASFALADFQAATFYGALSGNVTGNVTGNLTGDVTGNASTATALETARTIGGVSFDGSANINLPGVNTTGNQDTTGNAATATKWATGRTIALTGDVTGTSGSFDGSGNLSFATTVAANVIGANELNVTGNGTTAQFLRSDGDGTFTWATPTDTNTTYSAGNGISLSGTTFSVAAGTGLTQDASGLSISNGGVSSTQLASATSLVIYNSAGTALKTLYGAGS